MSLVHKLNFKAIVVGILVCIGTAFGMYEVSPSIIKFMNPNTDLSCNSITIEDWQKSPIHDEAKSLDEFKQLCLKYNHQLNDVMPQQIQFVMTVLPSILVICAFAMFRLHIKDFDNQMESK
uniref:ORF13 n=1 Tax=Nitrosopumilaceae spindle-shaped virus TaxID=3065433 RepID=A0AAT9J9Z0_9VIRU